MLDTNHYSSLSAFKKLTPSTKDAIRKLSSFDGPVTLLCLNVATQKECETIALSIGLAHELCFNYEEETIFNEFQNPRNFLYSCLKVILLCFHALFSHKCNFRNYQFHSICLLVICVNC